MKNRKQKEKEYLEKYSNVPKEYKDRILYMIDKYNLSENEMDQIINRMANMEYYLQFKDFKIVLYEEPEGTPRHRYRIITPKNYISMAMANPSYVHVYQPRAGEDHQFGVRLVEGELNNLQQMIQTPFTLQINTFSRIPSTYSRSDIFMAEMGLDRNIKKPDVDNMEKKYLDMFNSTLWLDDNMCIGGNLCKFFSELPRVEIYIRYMNYAMNSNQYKHIISRVNYNPELNLEYLNKLGEPERK